MVHGIVSLLDGEHYAMIEDLWREFERDFGLSWVVRRVPYPHFSYHVAEHYDVEKVEAMLTSLSQRIRPFRARVAGLGIFTGSEPVLTALVVRSLPLNEVHRRVWQAVGGLAEGADDYYRPENWMPHITLARGDLNQDNLPGLVRWLHARDFDWEFMVDNLTFIYDDGVRHHIRIRATMPDGSGSGS